MQESGDKDGNHDCHADDSAKTRTVNLDDLPLQAGLIDESDLEGVATLLIEVQRFCLVNMQVIYLCLPPSILNM